MVGRKRKIQKLSSKAKGDESVIEILDDDGDYQESMVESKISGYVSRKKSTPQKIKEAVSVGSNSTDANNDGGIDLKIPLSLLMTGTSTGSNECTVLVQVCPDDASTLDFHGAAGAVGRFEVNDDTVVTMDLKGFQYQGALQAGPTCIVASMHPMIGQNIIKVESITDEFVALQKTGDQLAQLDAVIEKGEMDDSFKIKDTNVNSKSHCKNLNRHDVEDEKNIVKVGSKAKNSRRKK